MNKVIKIILILATAFILAVILLLAAFAAYIEVKKPFGMGLKDIQGVVTGPKDSGAQNSYDHPFLSESQEKALESIGVDTSTLPTGFTAEQLACFTEKLGQERVNEIMSGSPVGTADYFKARACME